MLYIIPVQSISINEAIQVEDEMAVAEYFLTKDSSATLAQKVVHFIVSDAVVHGLFRIARFDVRSKYLNHIYSELNNGMYSSFCWGDEKFAKKYFSS